MSFPAASGDIHNDFHFCCSREFLEVLPVAATELLEAGRLQQFVDEYPQFHSRFAAEVRALMAVMSWLSVNNNEESRRRRRDG